MKRPIIMSRPLAWATTEQLVLAGLDTTEDRQTFRALLRQLATHASALDPVQTACGVAQHAS
jgi:hypothetical protein